MNVLCTCLEKQLYIQFMGGEFQAFHKWKGWGILQRDPSRCQLMHFVRNNCIYDLWMEV